MKTPQSPAPVAGRPLSAEDVALLRKGDLLGYGAYDPIRVGDPGVTVESIETAVFRGETFTFIGRPDADGWMPWSGGENPTGDTAVEVRYRNGETEERAASRFGWTHWADPDRPTLGVYDIIAFRLSRPASEQPDHSGDATEMIAQPVEAIGAGREEMQGAGFLSASIRPSGTPLELGDLPLPLEPARKVFEPRRWPGKPPDLYSCVSGRTQLSSSPHPRRGPRRVDRAAG